MIVQRNFNKRTEDINEIYLLIDFIANIESHKNQPIREAGCGRELLVTQEMQCALKAQFLMLLYNIVESTVCDCLNSFYDSITDDGLTFEELSDEMQTMWTNYLRRKYKDDIKKVEEELRRKDIRFDAIARNVSGNLDMRRIIEVFSDHGCTLDETNRKSYSDSFLAVKQRRNTLAHGNISFSECGSNYMVSDLLRFKEDILSGLQEIVTQAKQYVTDRRYRRN